MTEYDQQEEHGECVESQVWVPVWHPTVNDFVNLPATYHDHMLLPDDIAELEAIFAGPTIEGKADDYYDSEENG